MELEVLWFFVSSMACATSQEDCGKLNCHTNVACGKIRTLAVVRKVNVADNVAGVLVIHKILSVRRILVVEV